MLFEGPRYIMVNITKQATAEEWDTSMQAEAEQYS